MDSRAVEKEIVELERQYWQAIKEKDIDTVMRLTDDPCIVTGAQGLARVDRQTFERTLRAAPWTLHSFKLSDDVQARLLSDDVAIIAYKVREEMTVEGKPVTFEAADTSTWVRRGGRWVCALHTEAIAGDSFGRDRQTMK